MKKLTYLLLAALATGCAAGNVREDVAGFQDLPVYKVRAHAPAQAEASAAPASTANGVTAAEVAAIVRSELQRSRAQRPPAAPAPAPTPTLSPAAVQVLAAIKQDVAKNPARGRFPLTFIVGPYTGDQRGVSHQLEAIDAYARELAEEKYSGRRFVRTVGKPFSKDGKRIARVSVTLD